MSAMLLRSFWSFKYNIERFNKLIEGLKISDDFKYPLVQSSLIIFNYMIPQIVIMYSLHQSIKQSIDISKHQTHLKSSMKASVQPTDFENESDNDMTTLIDNRSIIDYEAVREYLENSPSGQ